MVATEEGLELRGGERRQCGYGGGEMAWCGRRTREVGEEIR